MNPKYLVGTIALYLVCVAGVYAAVPKAEVPEDVPVLTPEQLENYQFEDDGEAPPKVEDLNVGQQFILDAQRREITDLIARRLGVLELKGTREDLNVFQRVVDRDLLRDDEIKKWQSLGIVFGDVLANEYDLHWVSYEDKRGTSRALQWRDTMNFVFPITVFSKRVEFGQEIDVKKIYEKIGKEIESFKETNKAGGRIRS